MKEHEQPPPLDEMADTPPELLQVMRALGREAPSRAALERVARQLGPLMDAAPGLPVASAVKTGSVGKFVIARAVAALLAVGGTVYWLQSDKAPPVATSPSVVVAAPVARVVPEPAEVPAVLAPEAAREVAREFAPEVQPVRRPRPHRVHAKRVRMVEPRSVATAVEPPSATEVVAAVEAATVAPPVEAPKPVEREATPPPPPPQPDEFGLLWQARERMRGDPAAALALLQTHAARFANGQLAPEREVLAVEALRALGRKDEAERRLQAFRKRYPGSIHLRRLQQAE